MADQEWVEGRPVETDTTNFEWMDGRPYIVTELVTVTYIPKVIMIN